MIIAFFSLKLYYFIKKQYFIFFFSIKKIYSFIIVYNFFYKAVPCVVKKMIMI